jgi:hypothetical protein
MLAGSPNSEERAHNSHSRVLLVSKNVMVSFAQALLAVVAGNAAYLLLMPHLPPVARHAPFQMDLGILIDFWFCLVGFGLVKTVWGRNRDSKAGKR